mgnify:CR=1 FL=1
MIDSIISQMEASFKLKRKYSVKSVLCQKQQLADCLVFAVAKLVLVGDNISDNLSNRKSSTVYLFKISNENAVEMLAYLCYVRSIKSYVTTVQ